MRRKTSTLGAVLLLIGIFLYFNAPLMVPLTTYLGSSGTDTVFDRNNVVIIPPQGSSSFNATLANGDTLSVALTTHPGNIDVLLMNQGNFSLWSASARSSYSTYSESVLDVSDYTFVFTNAEKNQTFYLVLVSHSSNDTTEVLLHAIGTRPSESALLLFPATFGLVGILVLGVGLRGGGSKKEAAAKTAGPAAQARNSQPTSQAGVCRHCGAALKPGSNFCPSCNKSQL